MRTERIIVGTPSRHRPGSQTLRNTGDLLVLGSMGLLLPALFFLSDPWLRVPLGLAMALFAPGYALLGVLFPRRNNLDGVARVALSLGVSAALLPVLAMVLSALPWGIHPWPIALSLSIWITTLCLIGLWQRRSLVQSSQAYTPPASGMFDWWQNLKITIRMSYTISLLAILTGIFFLRPILMVVDPSIYTTEFYVLGKKGLAEDYPREAVVGANLAVTLGIVNRERTAQTYRVEVQVNADSDSDQRVVVAQVEPTTLSPGQSWEEAIVWQMPNAGRDQQIELLLFTEDIAEPYRRLRLWLNVIEP